MSALSPSFQMWCQKFDYLFKTKGQKKEFHYYLAGLLGESKRKNIAQITDNLIGSSYNNIHHFILVFVAYTFIIYQQLMGGMRKHYAHKPLTNFTETLEAFLTGVSYNFFCWLEEHQDVFVEHKANLGFVWG